MTELDLYKFCQDKEIDWRGDKLVIWLSFFEIKDFVELVDCGQFDDGGMEVTLMHNCIAFELNDLCDIWDIDPESILKKE